MALTPRLELKHSQTLVMTPQLQQAIKLLQYTNLELTDYISQEIEKNPLLEIGDSGGNSDAGPGQERDGGLVDMAAPDIAPPSDGTHAASDVKIREGGTDGDSIDTDFDNVYNNDSPADLASGLSGLSLSGGSIRGSGGGDGDLDFEQNLTQAESLRDHLESQLAHLHLTPAAEMISRFLVDMVDESGYLREDIGGVAERLDCSLADVEAVLVQLQGFEPSGVFARSLQECLAIQLRDLDRFDPAMEMLVQNLELLARRDLVALRRICGVDQEDLTDMVTELQALNPKPGLAYSSEMTMPVVPDVFVRRGPKGSWIIDLNGDTLPRVLVNTSYHTEIFSRTSNKEEKAFISDCYNSANWLVKALDQRAKTILKVATEIVRQQEGFFLQGVRHLRPMNLRMIADAISMHESTVSRVTANKYLATDRGIFEMKYFFTSAIQSSGEGEAHASESVKQRIKELIDAESPASILSDDRIVEILIKERIDIARRTVAKYRDALKIPSSVQRRRQKAAV
ncbi:RNA polymerase factor sigma-54 [Govanella unica]|uniref:RNA polymerase sigma-54 factor n=1 Tax=Govanella unica TaxID=2975056 RepID=A0A9X3Z6C6_9PROT|nr:RNA polymerase factor sigma-54 [Govania unica]MDA5192991.1 RNA polymerase factor sigma-54 [Govania unica]